MPKRKNIPQPELNEITDRELLKEREILLDCLYADRFGYIKTYKDSDEYLFSEIKAILSKASRREQIFIKNYYMLPDELKADFKINKIALKKNPYIYFLIDHDIKDEYAIAYAKILMQTDGSFYRHIPLYLVEQNQNIAFNAVKSRPNIFQDLPAKYTENKNFIEKCLRANPLIYCQLSSCQRKELKYLSIIYEYTQPQDIPKIFQAIPQKFKALKKDILEIITFLPQVYGLLSHKKRSDEQIAVRALIGDYKQIANIPKGMHFKFPIIDAYFLRTYSNKDIETRVYEFKCLTKRNITTSDLVEKIIKISPKNKMIYIAKTFSSFPFNASHAMLNSKNMIKLLKKSPQAFAGLDQVHDVLSSGYIDIVELAIKLDYTNFKYVRLPNLSSHFDTKCYEEIFMLANKIYQAGGSKDTHPFKYASSYIIPIKRLKKIITHRVDGKVIVDYVNIFRYGRANIKKSKQIYVNALNINPGLAKDYPVTKTTKKTIFKDLNIKARKVLFKSWIQKKELEDILEIAHIKKEILELPTSNDA